MQVKIQQMYAYKIKCAKPGIKMYFHISSLKTVHTCKNYYVHDTPGCKIHCQFCIGQDGHGATDLIYKV